MEFNKNKVKLKIAISKIKEENDVVMENKTKNILKTTSTIIAGIILGTGVVFAGTKVYEKIWKEPQKYTHNEIANQLPPPEITEEEKTELITEEEAKAKGIEILNKLGYENQNINKIELKRGYDDDLASYYMIKTKLGYEEGLMVQLNAKDGSFEYFGDMDLKYKHLPTQKISNEEISKIATNIYEKLGINNEYKLTETKINDYYFENQSSDLIQASFNKYYENIANKYESLDITFLVSENKMYLNTIRVCKDNSYEKNDLIISKEEAITIAQNKEKEFSNYNITNINAELSIEKMNSFIYQIENNLYDITKSSTEQEYYKTENRTRKVWKIKIEHGLKIQDFREDMNKYIKEGMSKYYYIDASTGEIIGGEADLFS